MTFFVYIFKNSFFNIIENTPVNSFIKSYKNKMIDKITQVFKTKEQQMFIASFYCYLKYDPRKDFVIEFENVWKFPLLDCIYKRIAVEGV